LISVVFAYEFHLREDGTRGVASKNHSLKGDWKGFDEFHIGGDLLIIYHYVVMN
jgi:mRNA-degrading endonuclease YafQ of YafQ-DinJ toxin-antitoxin module